MYTKSVSNTSLQTPTQPKKVNRSFKTFQNAVNAALELSNKQHDNEEKKSTEAAVDIKLSEFLDFMKLSCQVNEMITTVDQIEKRKENTKKKNVKITKVTESTIDFQKLTANPVLNGLIVNNKPLAHCHCQPNKECSHSADNKRANPEDSRTNVTDATQTLRRRSSTGSAFNFPQFSNGKSLNRNSMGLHPKLTEKLDNVLNEGVLDSVLPFICPVPVPTPRRITKKTKRNSIKSASATESNADANDQLESPMENQKEGAANTITTKHNTSPRSHISRIKQKLLERKEHEVVIHVCDELKNTTRDFYCPQNLLVSKMGYFADITAGQRLQDMDISVHCDIQIFDWLIRWVKQEGKYERGNISAASLESGPLLDAGNVVPILVSATFLQMEPLMLDCLSFCHARLGEVVRAAANLSCLNDAIITRLAAMFTNMELELVRDRKERVTPRLWTKFIQSLCEPEPETLRGHHYSLAGLFRCARCGKCITNTMQSYIGCLNNNTRLNRWGQLVSQHVRDPNWDINVYIAHLYKDLKSWRRVYWSLWGHCHFLYCCICERHFPVYQMLWCRYHSESPHFLGPVSEGRIAGPTGRYPCCGQQAFRYETLQGPNGCHYREHNVLMESDRDRLIYSIAQYLGEQEVQTLYEQPTKRMRELISCGEIETNWSGITLSPMRRRTGLLPILNSDDYVNKRRSNKAYNGDSSSDSDSSEEDDSTWPNKKYYDGSDGASGSRNCSTSSDGCESEYSLRKSNYTKKSRRRRRNEIAGRYWSGELSARSNQDHQREFEEKVMKQVVKMVSKNNASEHSLGQSAMPMAGSYYRLESEWKDYLKQRANANNLNGSASASNITTNGNGLHGSQASSSNLCLAVSTISANTTFSNASKRLK